MPAKHDNMTPTRNWLLYKYLGGPKVSDKAAAAVVERMLENDGATDSSNMHALAVVVGKRLGLVTDEQVNEWIASDLRCSWFYDKATGIKNAEATWSHGALEELPFLIAQRMGFDAKANIGSRVRFVRESDPFFSGLCRTAGNRSPSRLKGSDYLDFVARALRGAKFERSQRPNAQDAKLILQQLFPDLHALADASELPRWYEPITVQWTSSALYSFANLPRKKGMEATWSICSDRFGRILSRNQESFELNGPILGQFTTPPRLDAPAPSATETGS